MRLMENAEIVKPDVFGTKAKVMEENENETKYQMQCDTPNGFMHCYHLFSGIDLAYSTFEASSCRMRNRAMPNILEIAFVCTRIIQYFGTIYREIAKPAEPVNGQD